MLPVFIDTLESRRLLSASFNSGTGVLTVNGSNSADTINLANSGSNTVVTISPEGFNQSFVTANITRIDIFCGDGADTLTTDAAITLNIAVDGEGGKDTLTTGAGDDTLFGGSEDDLLDGRTGGDTFAGDTGIDTLSYLGRTAPINVTLDGAQNDGESGEGDQVLTTIDIIFGGSGNDTFDATGAPANFRGWYGNAGNDTLIGGNGDDRLNGGPGDDSLVGADGDDTFVGGDGNDVFSGGNGTDNVTYYNSNRAIRATLGTASGNGAKGTTESDNLSAGDLEILIGGTGNDSLTGGSGNDALYGGDGADLLIGGAGNDYLVGGSGKDSLRGGDGNDTLRGQTSGDLMSGEAGIDLVSYSERTAGISATLASSGTTTDNGAAGEHDQIDSTVENLEGGAGNDTLVGNNASNFILGRAGADTINSQDGVIDTVDGGDGTDAITSDPSLDIVTNP